MAIEFHCPNGHILEVDDQHAGVQIRCPACDVRCLVPPSGATSATASTEPVIGPPDESLPSVSPRKRRKTRSRGAAGRRLPTDMGLPGMLDTTLTGAAAGESSALENPISGSTEKPISTGIDLGGIGAANRRTLHMECKKCKQPLEIENEMLGQDLACPACGQAFRAELKRTVEFQREKAIKQERAENKLSERWLYTAIFAGLLIVAGLVAMIAWSATR